MINKKTLWVLVALNALALGIILVDRASFDDRIPIERWDQVEVLNSPILAGEGVEVRIWRKKVRDDCPVSSSRQAIDRDGHVINLEDAVFEGGPAGTEYFAMTYLTVSDMPVGEYLLRVNLTYSCPDFVWTTQQPDARFRVVKEK
jgi:hypothetical protein